MGKGNDELSEHFLAFTDSFVDFLNFFLTLSDRTLSSSECKSLDYIRRRITDILTVYSKY